MSSKARCPNGGKAWESPKDQEDAPANTVSPGRGATYRWGDLKVVVQRSAADGSWVDLTCTRGGSSWGKRMAFPLPSTFVRVD